MVYGVSDPRHWPWRNNVIPIGRVIVVVPREPSREELLGPIGVVRPSIFIWKSSCFLIPFFSNFGSTLGPKMDRKSKKVTKTSTSKPHLNSDSFSTLFFYVFLLIFDPLEHDKYSKNDRGLFVCTLFLFFSFSSFVGPIFYNFKIDFGKVLGSIFQHFPDQGAIKN